MATVHVKVGNDCDRKVSYFVYDSTDSSEYAAKASGDLDKGIENNPEIGTNLTNEYTVKFTPPGQLNPPLAAGTIKAGKKISIHGVGEYHTEIT